jgi:hypothetical protein
VSSRGRRTSGAFYGGRYIGCDIGNPSYDAFARLCGAEGYYAETPDQVGDTVKAALGCGKQAGGGQDPDRPRRVPDAGRRRPPRPGRSASGREPGIERRRIFVT